MQKIRSSKQLHIDADLDVNSKKLTNVADGIASTDAATKGQMDTAIIAATSGIASSIHAPVQNLAAAVAINAAGRADKMLMNIEDLGQYRFDAESLAVSDNATTMLIIRPTDVASDAAAGRWIRFANPLQSHELLSNILGNGGYHLSLAERDKLTGIEANADVTDEGNVGGSIEGAAAVTAIADANKVAIIVGGVLKTLSWLYVKSNLKTYFDTLYNLYTHPNHTGDVTSDADGAQTIAAGAVTNSKMANMAAYTFKVRKTNSIGAPEDGSVAEVKTLLGLNANNQSSRYYRASPTGNVNGSNTDFVIAAVIASGTEEVFKNGLLMNAGAGNDYTIAYNTPAGSSTITFLEAPSNTGYADVILVNYSVA